MSKVGTFGIRSEFESGRLEQRRFGEGVEVRREWTCDDGHVNPRYAVTCLHDGCHCTREVAA